MSSSMAASPSRRGAWSPGAGPFGPGGRPSDPAGFWRRRLAFQAATVALAGLPIIAVASSTSVGTLGPILGQATLDLSFSFVRMLLAYMLSLIFAFTYGYLAASTRLGERILIPVLDILQSVPILGFFPVAVAVFIQLLGSNNAIGPNLASIFLIFTSMSWNMAFGVYESLKSIPGELREATDSFGARGPQRVRDVLVPATMNRLVYNSVLSWTSGWYFLVAAEFIATASSTTALPGIGTFLLSNAAPPSNTPALLIGLALLVTVIALLDLVVWRPLARWAERFRYDQSPSGESDLIEAPIVTRAPLRRAAGIVVRGVRTSVTRLGTPFIGLATLTIGGPAKPPSPRMQSILRYGGLGFALVLTWLLLIYLGVGVFHVFTSPIDGHVQGQLSELPLALGSSFARVVAAYAICVAISVPLAFALFQRAGFSRVGLPLVEVIASVPATALFPLFLISLLGVIGPELTSVLMLVTGMVWYLFFNVLSGLRNIPPDLAEAARSFGLGRREFYRRVAVPAMLPAFITGSITAFGGGWNTLVIAENVRYGSTLVLQVPGIGELLDRGNLEANGFPLMVGALFTLVIAVIAVNELIWKPLYRRAVERYRID